MESWNRSKSHALAKCNSHIYILSWYLSESDCFPITFFCMKMFQQMKLNTLGIRLKLNKPRKTMPWLRSEPAALYLGLYNLTRDQLNTRSVDGLKWYAVGGLWIKSAGLPGRWLSNSRQIYLSRSFDFATNTVLRDALLFVARSS